MRVMTSIKHGTHYIHTKLGAVVTAVQQVAMVKGLAMWEVERVDGNGGRKRFIVSAKTLTPMGN